MKGTISQIKTAIELIQSKDLSSIQRKATENSWLIDHNEYTLADGIGDIDYLLNLILSAIDNNLLDNLTYDTRITIHAHLNQVNQYIEQILGGDNQISSFLSQISQLKNLIRQQHIDFEQTTFPSYAKKRNELNNLIKKYTELIDKIQIAEQIENALKAEVQVATKANESINQNLQQSVALLGKMNNTNDDVQTRKTELEVKYAQANESSTQINTIKSEIEKFHGSIKINGDTLRSTINESSEIIKKHRELQKNIDDLLPKALSNNLFRAFKVRADELQRRIWYWFAAIVISLIAGVIMGIWIAIDFEGKGVNELFVFKLFLTAPIVYSILFFTRQFGQDRKLQEEYAFKSTISLSIVPFREELLKIAKQEAGRTENLAITSKTMDKVFSSPIENISKNPIKDKEDTINIEKLTQLISSLQSAK